MAIISMTEARENQIKEEREEHKRKPKRIYQGLKEEEFIKLLEATGKVEHKIIFLLCYGAGIRLSEAVNIQPNDIDLKTGRMMIRQGKGGKDRTVGVPKGFKEKYLTFLPIKIKARAVESSFLRNSLKAGINEKIGEYTTKNGKVMPLWKYRVHSLRHSWAVRALEKGVPINVVQQILGHENLATTTRYTKIGANDAIQALIDKGI